MNIAKMVMLEFHIAFAGLHTALSNRFASRALQGGGSIYGARIDGEYAGYLIVTDEENCEKVVYAAVFPKYRNQGVFTALMKYVMEVYASCIQLTIPSSHAYFDAIRKTCEKLGFSSKEPVHVFSCSRKDEDNWHSFMEKKGKRLCEMLEMHGYNAVSFQEMDDSMVQQLRQSDRSSYANSFHPAQFLDDPSFQLSPELSFAAEREGRLAAYCLVSRGNETSAVFEQISVSADELGHGVILLPYVYSMQRFFELGFSCAYYAMYASNKHANAFRKKILQIFPSNEEIHHNYCYIPPKEGR